MVLLIKAQTAAGLFVGRVVVSTQVRGQFEVLCGLVGEANEFVASAIDDGGLALESPEHGPRGGGLGLRQIRQHIDAIVVAWALVPAFAVMQVHDFPITGGDKSRQ